jgi:copper chaperone
LADVSSALDLTVDCKVYGAAWQLDIERRHVMSRLMLTVTGMSCTGCEQRIAAALGRLDGIDRVEADHRAGTVAVDHEPGQVPEAAIRERLSQAGDEVEAVWVS